MEAQQILLILILIVTVNYLWEQVLDYLNLKAIRKEIPQQLAGIYDAEKYAKSLDYLRANTKFSFLTSAFSVALSIAMLLSGGFGWLDSLLRDFFANEIFIVLAFFGVLAVASDVLTIPFQWYSTFVIETRFGFNKTTPKLFIIDKLKGYGLGVLIGAPLLAALIFLVKTIGPSFWIWFSAIAILYMLFMNVFYTSLFVPLFNKLTPLAEGPLKSAIQNFSTKVDFPLENVLVIDGSKRSSKANAYFSGLGKRKKIVLFDTLVDKHTTEELVAVVAHEVGHYKKKHILFGILLSAIQITFTMWLLSLFIYNEQLSFALGGNQLSMALNLIAFTLLFTPVSILTGLLLNVYSRKNEFEADVYAAHTADGSALIDALKRLSVDSLSNLHPHSLYVFFHYSHPPLVQRISALLRHQPSNANTVTRLS